MNTTSALPFFSIILPVFNGGKFIAETIQSVLQQSFAAWELIVIDDGSTDDTATIVNDFCRHDDRMKILEQPNKKQPAARNAGIKIAKGQWIAFIDADDLWLPSKLELQHQLIKENGDLDVIFSDGYTKYEDKVITFYYHHKILAGFFRGKDLYKKMIFDNYIPILSVVFKSSWVSKAGMQDETVPGVEDHDYWLRLCRLGANFYGMEDRLFVYRIHSNNFSSDAVNQHHLSLIIRIKNFDLQLVNNEETKRFKRVFKKYLEYFRKQGKIEWEQDLKARFERLNIPPVPIAEKISDSFSAFVKGSKVVVKRILKRCVFFLLVILYFYPKKILSNYKQRISTLYTNWLNARNIINPQSISHSTTASINFYKRYNSKLDVQSIHIGDYSQINFVKDDSRFIGGSNLSIGKFCIFNIVGELVLGNNVLFNNHSTLTCHKEIVIGDNSWFGEGVRFYDHNHRYKDRNRPFTQQGYDDGKIEIGNNVWVGSNTVILKNVSIGDGCVIGANNVIYKSLPPNTIVKSRSMELIDVIK